MIELLTAAIYGGCCGWVTYNVALVLLPCILPSLRRAFLWTFRTMVLMAGVYPAIADYLFLLLIICSN